MGFFDRFRTGKTSQEPDRPGLGLPNPDDDWTPPDFVEAVKMMAADDSADARAEFHRQLIGMQLWIPAAAPMPNADDVCCRTPGSRPGEPEDLCRLGRSPC